MHKTIEPTILYFGTPVALISTLNEDGSPDLAPMPSSASERRSTRRDSPSRTSWPACALGPGSPYRAARPRGLARGERAGVPGDLAPL